MKIRTTHLAGVFWALACVALNTNAALAQSDLFPYDLLREPVSSPVKATVQK